MALMWKSRCVYKINNLQPYWIQVQVVPRSTIQGGSHGKPRYIIAMYLLLHIFRAVIYFLSFKFQFI
jgi:hypothetical protein